MRLPILIEARLFLYIIFRSKLSFILSLIKDIFWRARLSRAGGDSPSLAGPYFRGTLIRWAWHHQTKSDQIDGWSVQLLRGWKGKIEKTLGKKKLMPQLGIEPFACEASACEANALTTEPS